MKELSGRQLVNVERWGFVRSQALFFIGSLFIIIGGLYALLLYKPFKKYRPFFWSIVFTLSLYIYLKAKDYYAIGIYPVYIAFGSVFLSHILSTDWKRYIRPVAVLIPVLIFIPMYQLFFPNKSPDYILSHADRYKQWGLLRWEDGKDHALPQDFADMLGWKELAFKVDSLYATLSHPDNTLVLCDNYGQAGAINFYSKKGISATSFNADYINWFNLNKPYIDLIRVKWRSEKDEELKNSIPFFQTGILADSITNSNAREYGTAIFVFTGAKIDIRKRIEDEIMEVKNRWKK